ncbi:MAG TPA: SDR family oxidoreductase [Sphingobium sp.]|uniref:SDR family NAD(P)-dependent oxidoreductase n=1 Tax=Sphingobium sp. TaxID=1912891 RepID=UPI002ED0AF25
MTKADYGLSGKKIVFVGASSGIGLAVATEFARQGVELTITSHLDDVFEARDKIQQETGAKVTALKFDISRREEVIAAFTDIGDIDVLVNNAGIGIPTPPGDRSDKNAENFVRHFEVNVFGLYWCAQEAIARMKPGGKIIFTASIWARLAMKGNFLAYISSKHAVLGMVRSLACDLGEKGITVNAVCPGSMATEMNMNGLTADDQAALMAQMVIRPGLIDPKHLAGAYMFLASDGASEITGQEISVDRGQSIGGNQG